MTPGFYGSPLAALGAGLVAGLHCAGMCGPLVCAVAGRTSAARSALYYHTGRFLAYSFLGGVCGKLGKTVIPWLGGAPLRWLPAAFVVFFVVVALGWDRRVSWPARWSGVGAAFMRRAHALPRPLASLLLGLGTPFLPCGPLYLALGVALFSGSYLAGSALMTFYFLGTVPALLFLQLNWIWLARKLAPEKLYQIQRVLAVVAAGLVLWRALGGASLLDPGACPLCR